MKQFSVMLILCIIYAIGTTFGRLRAVRSNTSRPHDTITKPIAMPDSTLGKFLDQFPNAGSADLSVDRIVLSVQGAIMTIKTFGRIKNIKKPKDLTDSEDYKYKNIIPLSKREIKLAALQIGLVSQANQLVRTDFHFPAAGRYAPFQNRILYVYGGKNYHKRQTSSNKARDQCPLMLNGLDCSGFIRQLFLSQQIDFPINSSSADQIRHTAFLQKYLKARFAGYSLTISDLGSIPLAAFNTGDLIYFTNKGSTAIHIGFIARDTGTKVILYHSSGWENACSHNSSDEGGLRSINLTEMLYKSSYHIVRILIN